MSPRIKRESPDFVLSSDMGKIPNRTQPRRDHERVYMPGVGFVPTGPRAQGCILSPPGVGLMVTPPSHSISLIDSTGIVPNTRECLMALFAQSQEQRVDSSLRQRQEQNVSSPFVDARRSQIHRPPHIKQEESVESGLIHAETGNRDESTPGERLDRSDSEGTFQSAQRQPSLPTSPTSEHLFRNSTSDPDLPSTNHKQWTPHYRCECPIRYDCQSKPVHLIDCRTLIPEQAKWRRTQQVPDPWVQPPDPEIEHFASLAQIRQIIDPINAITMIQAGTNRIREQFALIEMWIYLMQTLSVHEGDVYESQVIPTLSNFLSDANQPNRREKRIPDRLQEDLLAILRKWQRGDFGALANRAFIRDHRNRWVRNPDWVHDIDARFYGEGHLVNGMRWNSRRQMVVEGAHAATIAGIAGTIRGGAYSVVMGYHDPKNKTYYADIDMGNTVEYISTGYVAEEGELPSNEIDYADQALIVRPEDATIGARALMRSQETGQPVRMFRSFRLAPVCKLRPDKGYRYDGLYTVVDHELLKHRRHIYRFRMVRLPGQGPIRGTPVATVPASKFDGRGTKRPRHRTDTGDQRNKSAKRRRK